MAEVHLSLHGVDGIRGSIIARKDGIVISHSVPAHGESGRLAAAAAAVFGIGEMLSEALHQGKFHRATMEAEKEQVLYVGAGPEAILAILLEAGADLDPVVPALKKEARKVERIISGFGLRGEPF